MRKGFRKLAAVAAAALTICAMTVTAFAQGSVQSTGVVTITDGNAVDANGTRVQASMEAIPAEYADAVNSIKTEEGLKAVLGDVYVEGMVVVDAADVTVPEGTPMPVTITFTVPGVGVNTKVAVLHYNGSAWEVVESKAGEGTITATFTSLSPVAFVIDKNTAVGDSKPAGDTVSPKTGENTGVLAAVSVAALTALAAGCVFWKKRRNFA